MQASRKMYRAELPSAFALQGYRIESVLGQGAFGITYRAYDVNLNRSVAIKGYLPGLIAGRIDGQVVGPASDDVADEFASGLTNFVNEAKTLAKFEHPNIVRVHTVFEANGTAYMVMQYEEGDILSDILRKRGTLTEHEIMQFIFPLLSGLEAVHEAGFIHRDIKPANIFIRMDGTPILLDYGSARQVLGSHTRELTNLVTKRVTHPLSNTPGKKTRGALGPIFAASPQRYIGRLSDVRRMTQ
jgi:serine/threonine protein kinase